MTETNGSIKDIKKQQLNKIINEEYIKSVYHPIISLKDGSIYGYEALTRITLENCYFNIEEAFVLADEFNLLWPFEKLCKQNSLKHASSKPKGSKIFLNIEPNIIHDDELKEGFNEKVLNKYNLKPENIVFEATERTLIEDTDEFSKAIAYYKNKGFGFAIDDVGTGNSGLNRLFSLTPHFIKIDKMFIRDIQNNEYKQSLIKSITNFAHEMNVYTIAEGVETYEELETLIQLNVHYAQGYYWTVPIEEFYQLSDKQIEEIKNLNSKYTDVKFRNLHYGSLNILIDQNDTVLYNDPLVNAFNLIKENPKLSQVVVVDEEDNFLGILPKALLVENFLFKKNLDSTALASDYLVKDCLTFDGKLNLHTVCKTALDRDDDKVYNDIIILNQNKYVGLLTMKELFLAIMPKFK